MKSYLLLALICLIFVQAAICRRHHTHKKHHHKKHQSKQIDSKPYMIEDYGCTDETGQVDHSMQGQGFTQDQCPNQKVTSMTQLVRKCKNQSVTKIANWELMWEEEWFQPNPNWGTQGNANYLHRKVGDTPEEKQKYCQELGKKPSNRTDDISSTESVGDSLDDPAYTPHFFAEDMDWARNPPLSMPDEQWNNLPICLGFHEDINDYINKNTQDSEPNKKYCKRLLSWFWTETFNMRFIYCVANGHLGTGGYVWTTASNSADRQSKKGVVRKGLDRVTAGEACLAASLGMSWPDWKFPCTICQSKIPHFCEYKDVAGDCTKSKQLWAKGASLASRIKSRNLIKGVHSETMIQAAQQTQTQTPLQAQSPQQQNLQAAQTQTPQQTELPQQQILQADQTQTQIPQQTQSPQQHHLQKLNKRNRRNRRN